MSFRSFAFAAACLAALTAPAFADTNITVLHVSENPAQKAVWEKIAADYNAAAQGRESPVQVSGERSLQGEAADDVAVQRPPRPVLQLGRRRHAGAGQGRLPQGHHRRCRAPSKPTMAPTAVDAFKVDGKVVGVPFEVGEVAFYYNKKLFEKAGVKAEDIKTWDDFLGAVKKLKAAGITPIVVGAGEKWPMHFYYSYLVMRIGGETRAGRREGRQGRRLQERDLRRGRQAPARTRRARAVPARLSLDQAHASRPACSATERPRWT